MAVCLPLASEYAAQQAQVPSSRLIHPMAPNAFGNKKEANADYGERVHYRSPGVGSGLAAARSRRIGGSAATVVLVVVLYYNT